jgi:CRISPR/Cas system CSM-associated protein Csm4 (group 5 of RAMP superfamily)
MDKKEYRITMTINVFIPAESEEEAQQIFENMYYEFKDDKGRFETFLVEFGDIEEVVG